MRGAGRLSEASKRHQTEENEVEGCVVEPTLNGKDRSDGRDNRLGLGEIENVIY